MNKKSIRNINPQGFQSFSLSLVKPLNRKILPSPDVDPHNTETAMISVAGGSNNPAAESRGKAEMVGDSSAILRDGFRAEKLF